MKTNFILKLKFTNKPESVCRNLLCQWCAQHLLLDFLRRRVGLWADAPAGQSSLKHGWVYMKYLWVKRDIESRLTHIINRSYFFCPFAFILRNHCLGRHFCLRERVSCAEENFELLSLFLFRIYVKKHLRSLQLFLHRRLLSSLKVSRT